MEVDVGMMHLPTLGLIYFLLIEKVHSVFWAKHIRQLQLRCVVSVGTVVKGSRHTIHLKLFCTVMDSVHHFSQQDETTSPKTFFHSMLWYLLQRWQAIPIGEQNKTDTHKNTQPSCRDVNLLMLQMYRFCFVTMEQRLWWDILNKELWRTNYRPNRCCVLISGWLSCLATQLKSTHPLLSSGWHSWRYQRLTSLLVCCTV